MERGDMYPTFPPSLTLRILVVDPDLVFSAHYPILFEESFPTGTWEYKQVPTEAAGRTLYPEFLPHLVVLHVGLRPPAEICAFLRSHSSFYTGILCLGDTPSPEALTQSLGLGADDFCAKTASHMELVARISSVNRIRELADSLLRANDTLQKANERLSALSLRDELTGLYNMRFFNTRLEEEFQRAKRYGKSLSLLMLDVDHFKEVNDRFDHLVGSQVLKQLGAVLKASIRAIDIPVRFGGDEFVILLPETPLWGARALAVRMATRLVGTEFRGDTFRLHVSASFGISSLTGMEDPPQTATELLRRADQLLYLAKNQGRSRIVDPFNTRYIQPIFSPSATDCLL